MAATPAPNPALGVSEFREAYEAGRERGGLMPDIREIDGALVAIFPAASDAGGRIESLEEFMDQPRRITARPVFRDVPSFLAYLEAFSSPKATRLFGDQKAASVTALLDYHAPGEPSRCTHRATLQLAFSPAWQAWTQKNKAQLSQVDFAEFIEEHLEDIIEPDAAEVLEVVQHLEGTKSVAWRDSKRLSDGRVQLQYVEEIEARGGQKGDIQVPRKLRLKLPVYERGQDVEIEAGFRFRINADRLSFVYVLKEPQSAIDEAFDGVLMEIEEQDYTVLLGMP
jgi:uncharacterized protein YfdQ (DUF2303 family)